ncbi:MAG: helix-turn-helix transcriptional regulator [Clostridium sp.]|nr:helix-turn-helix transcriptional regulator [Clostridium sp.]
MYAYDEMYLDDAMDCLGEAVDYAANACSLPPDEFMELFIASGKAAEFGAGVPRVVSGRSGTELVMDILGEFWDDFEAPNPLEGPECSPEYWSGWILAYYQWKKGDSFESILKKLPMRDILQLYPVLHEASEEKFIDTADSIIRRKTVSARLQQLRRIGGYSQRLLSEKSGVNLRTLQQYEIGAKDINKASVTTILSLTRVLGCRPEDLLEYGGMQQEN